MVTTSPAWRAAPAAATSGSRITADKVSTLAVEPLMKNSIVAWVWAIVNAEAMPPTRLSAPPNTTTRKVSTM